MERNRRYQIREHMNIPILYTREYDNVYHQAITHDISLDGMSFGSDQKFSHGDYFLIKPMEIIPGFDLSLVSGVCTAQVKWCSKQIMDSTYTIGIQRVGTGDYYKKRILAPCIPYCELCGNRASGDVVKTDNNLVLCSDCFTGFSRLPGKSLKGTLNRFMVGNVI